MSDAQSHLWVVESSQASRVPLDTGMKGSHRHLSSLTLWLNAEKIRLPSPLPSLHAPYLPTFAVAFATSSNTPAPDVVVHTYHPSLSHKRLRQEDHDFVLVWAM